jgi:uncharacterized membrane protein YoaK (UPF0700 family)
MNEEHGRVAAVGLLSFTAGVMDAIAFLTLGEVFTSAMSGNTILLGLALGQGRITAALHSLVAFVGYICGVGSAAPPLRRLPHGIAQTLGLEALLLAAFAGLWTISGGPMSSPLVDVLIILSAGAMGLQGAIGRAIRTPGVPTIVITSTLTAVVWTLAEKILNRDRRVLTTPTRQQIASFLVYLVSAVIGGFVASRLYSALPFIPLAAVLTLALGLRAGVLRL